jgi:ATP-dependent Clp protease ATP-binding subunit ClpA
MLKEVYDRLLEKNIKLNVTAAAKEYIIDKGFPSYDIL